MFTWGDGVPIEEWAGECTFILRLSGNPTEAQWKRAWIARKYRVGVRPEAGWACHEQGEATVIGRGGPNRLAVQNHRMTCGKEWKAYRIP